MSVRAINFEKLDIGAHFKKYDPFILLNIIQVKVIIYLEIQLRLSNDNYRISMQSSKW